MTYRIDRGGQARPIKGAEMRRKIRRELHTLVLYTQGDRTVADIVSAAPVGVNVAQWWFDLRRGQQTIYGSLFRFIDIAIRLRTPKATLMKIPEVLAWYIEDNADEHEYTPPHRPPVMRRVA
jgi:hypothetical protein